MSTRGPLYGSVESGGTKMLCLLGTGPDDVAAHMRFPTGEPGPTLARVVAFFREATADHGPPAAVGVASFGPLELRRSHPRYGFVTNTPKPGWSNVDVQGRLARELGVPVTIDTDVNGAALGEGRWGAARGLETFVYITVGTGVGGAAVVGGRPVRGLVHTEIGHVAVARQPGDGFAGNCPFHGDCLEGMASGRAAAARWGRPAEELAGQELRRAVELEAAYLAEGLRNVVYCTAPERIVIGGGMSVLPGLFPLVRAELAKRLAGYPGLPEQEADDFVVPAALGSMAGPAGGLVLAARAATIARQDGASPDDTSPDAAAADAAQNRANVAQNRVYADRPRHEENRTHGRRTGETAISDSVRLETDVRAWLLHDALPGDSVRHARPLPGGYTNESIMLTTRRNERYVLRRYGSGGGGTAVRRNPCEVEAALLTRLRGRVPVPELVAADPDGRATGRPALVYRFVQGVMLSGPLADASPEGADSLGREVGAALARIGMFALPGPGYFEEASLVPRPARRDVTSDLPEFVERRLSAARHPDGRPGGTGRAAQRLSSSDVATLRWLAERSARPCAAVCGQRSLVHNDFNPKNVLVERRGDDRWQVAAVLDWELAFSGSPLVDVGNMLRFADDYPTAFSRGLTDAFQAGGGLLPPDWPRISRALDLFALTDILTRPPDDDLFARARVVMLRHAAHERGLRRSPSNQISPFI
ncbi:ROK family protein [Protofrankia sp. BMG5.30]|uniref:ROK family protein n=1 Tax=Protofrankia sp. BMG5.30 TaxID=1834514 RepID=UPI0009FAB356|nr:ROK family protein [Protofrankia sp. BMG5.30]